MGYRNEWGDERQKANILICSLNCTLKVMTRESLRFLVESQVLPLFLEELSLRDLHLPDQTFHLESYLMILASVLMCNREMTKKMHSKWADKNARRRERGRYSFIQEWSSMGKGERTHLTWLHHRAFSTYSLSIAWSPQDLLVDSRVVSARRTRKAV